MDIKPSVSIIIPTFNRAHFLILAVQSVLKQSYPNITEIIIIDDGSTDTTEEVAKRLMDSYSKIIYIRHETNRGVLAAKNTGLNLVKGEFIGILDDDDELFPDAVESLIKKYLEASRFKIIFGNCIRSDTRRLSGYGLNSDIVVKYSDVLCGRVHGEHWGVFAKELLGEDRFNEDMKGFEGHLWLKLYKRSDAYYIHKPVRLYRVGHASIIRNITFRGGASSVAFSYGKLIEMYKEDYVNLCPKYLSDLLSSKAYFEAISNNRWQSLSDIFEALRYNIFNFKAYTRLVLLLLPAMLIVFFGRALIWLKDKNGSDKPR